MLEIAAPCFGPEAKTAHDAARQLQSVLGEIHDCDAMLPRAHGIESLRKRLRAQREQLFGEFSELWRETTDTGVWVGLESSL